MRWGGSPLPLKRKPVQKLPRDYPRGNDHTSLTSQYFWVDDFPFPQEDYVIVPWVVILNKHEIHNLILQRQATAVSS